MENRTSKIALGSVQFGLDYGISNKSGQVVYAEVLNILKYYHEMGLTFIDTAYGYGNSEEVIGRVSQELGCRFDLITKIPICDVLECESIFLDSLKRLKTGEVYGCLFHDFDFFKNNAEYLTRFVEKNKKTHRISKWGVSVYFPQQIEYLFSNNINFDIVQLPYNILDRRFEYLFEELAVRGVEIHSRSVFLQGLFYINPQEITGKLEPLKKYIFKLTTYSNAVNVSLAELALSFAVNNPYISKVIVGVNSLGQLKENIDMIQKIAHKKPEAGMPHLDILEQELLLPSNWK